ncbi:MAG: hypothetical protein L0H59_10940, partial [Tomitella sp.]|nr:hypothetical protein [Tomitella sp.]
TAADGYQLNITEWQQIDRADGSAVPLPAGLDFTCGHQDLTDPGFRDTIERRFDRLVSCPGEWIYAWNIDAQGVTISHDERSSLAARRKRTERKFADDVRTAVGKTGKDPVVASVSEWADDESDQPAEITIDFGTLPLGERQVRDRFEDALDASIQSQWPDLRMLFDWQFGGGVTRLAIEAVSKDDRRAKQKAVEKKLRNVVEAKFGKARTPVDCDVLEWQDGLSEAGEALPLVAQVNFGAVDVAKADTRDEFEAHWESLAQDNDWHFRWKSAEGIVTMTAVPTLPDSVAFPEPGAPEFDEAIELARRGILRFGPRKGGGWLDLDLNDVPHALVGGKTGSGKSVLLTIVLFYAMWLPDVYQVIVCDPKRTDFTWTPEFPNVVRFAATDTEICGAVSESKNQMDERQSLLNKHQVRNLHRLRAKGDVAVPPRLILFFDEMTDFLAKSANEDVEELKQEARGDLESLGRLGRALEVNIIGAAQKPDAKIMSTQLRSQLGFRVGVGPLDQYESQQILNSDHGTRFPDEGTPKGRSWAYDSKGGYRMAQVMFLADDDMICPWDPSVTLRGMKQMLREHLTEIGYAQTTVTNADGGQEPRWVRMEDDEATDTEGDDRAPVDDAEPADTTVESNADGDDEAVSGPDSDATAGGHDADDPEAAEHAPTAPEQEGPNGPEADVSERPEPTGDAHHHTSHPVPHDEARKPSLAGAVADSVSPPREDPGLWDDV